MADRSIWGNFDFQNYLRANPDVAKAITLGNSFGVRSTKNQYGQPVFRSDVSEFESNNDTYAKAVAHYTQFGANENRKGGGSLFGGYYNPSNSDTSNLDNFNSSGNNGSNNNLSSSSNNSTTGLFGSTGGYLGTGVSFDDYVNKMKDLTQWRLGIDKQSMGNAYGFRDQEANRDFGFNTQLAGQQIQGQKDIQGQQIEGTKNLETLRNEYMNQRQREQLENQKYMQQSGFNQQNKLLVDNANRARSLYFGGR